MVVLEVVLVVEIGVVGFDDEGWGLFVGVCSYGGGGKGVYVKRRELRWVWKCE